MEMLARFMISLLTFGSVSDWRAANGGVMVCVKKAKKHNLNETGQAAAPSHYRGAARLAGIMPG